MRGDLQYQGGFENFFESEALAGALPLGQNSPQKVPYGLIAEQLSGSAFTEKRRENLRSWLYRIRPSVVQKTQFSKIERGRLRSGPEVEVATPPWQLRWDPPAKPDQACDFIDSLTTMCVNGDVSARTGSGVHLYFATRSMTDRFFYNADGDFLIVPQEGSLLLRTEFGIMEVTPTEMAVLQRGMKFQVLLVDDKPARGYICENYGAHFELPNLGPIGANGLANPRDFQVPKAHYEDKKGAFRITTKFLGELWEAQMEHSPLDVVAWHGNYAPYKYDLKLFNVINTVSFDHPDPSIFTVLTSPSGKEGVANVDFVIFPPRWMVAENTFRPPYYHRNIMSEYMGLIVGVYDAKASGGFVPGGGSLHNCMAPHGPDGGAYEEALNQKLSPTYYKDTLAFMFESCLPYRPTKFALEGDLLQKDYLKCWQTIKPTFNSAKK